MIKKPAACKGCVGLKWNQGFGFTKSEGSPRLGVGLMGEAAGEHESVDGLPFRPHAPAGSILRRVLSGFRGLGLQREDFLIWNTVSCRPPENWLVRAPWEKEVIAKCRVHRDTIINSGVKHGMKVIVALGEVAFKALTGYDDLFLWRGYPIWSREYGVWVVGALHPAFVMRRKNFYGVLRADIEKALWIAQNGVPERRELEKKFKLFPSAADGRAFLKRVRDNARRLLSVDIENPKQITEEDHDETAEWEDVPIVQIQFSLGMWDGVVFPYTAEFMPVIEALLKTENPKIGHNWWNYDGRVLRKAGKEVRGVVHDSMVLFHHRQSNIPGCYGLQSTASFFGALHPWKNLIGANMELYGCYDVSEPHRIFEECRQELIQLGAWKGYEQKLRLQPILVRMCARGIPMDVGAQERLSVQLDERMKEKQGEMNALVPQELWNAKQKEGYVKEPKDTTGLVLREFRVVGPVFESVEYDCKCKRGCKQCNKTGKRTRKVEVGEEERTEKRWCRLVEFSPSPDQIARYCKFKGYKIPHHRKEDRETTDEKALEELIKSTQDPLFQIVLDYREIQKLKGSYVDSWKPGKDGRVHATPGHLTASGQTTMRKPNTQQIPAHTDTAELFKACIVVPKGFVIVRADFSSFHAVMTGFEARDPLYIRMARLDMHSFFALCGMLKKERPERIIEMEDGEVLELFNHWKKSKKVVADGMTFKELRGTAAKRTVLGYGFGMEGGMLYKTYPEFFPKKKLAVEAIAAMNDLVPVTAAWRRSIVREAHRAGRLVSRFEYVREFHEAMVTCPSCHYRGRARCPRCHGEGMVFGKEAKEAIAFLPANDAHGHIKDANLRLERRGLLDRGKLGGLINYVHDDLQWEMRVEKWEEWARAVKGEMERPNKVLTDPILAPQGLSVAVEILTGPRLSEMKEVKL